MNNRRIIQIKNSRIFINPETSFSVEQTTFPNGSLSFSPHLERFLEVDLYFQSERAIMIIKNYHPQNFSSFYQSQGLKIPIRLIEFQMLNWSEFSKMASMYHKQSLLPFIDSKTIVTKPLELRSDERNFEPSQSNDRIKNDFDKQTSPYDEPLVYSRQFLERVRYKDAIFADGNVSILKKVKWAYQSVTLTVENSFLKKEFDTIKFYFGKKINGKDYFVINCDVSFKEQRLLQINTTSSEITQITPNLIEAIKTERILKASADKLPNDKYGISISGLELNKQLGGDPENILMLSPEQIVNILSNKRNIRNKAQLEYLAIHKHSIIHNLRYTIKPSFGFLFSVEGFNYKHFCWELLDKNATYIWSLPNTSNQDYTRVDEAINSVLEFGRFEYRNQYVRKLIDQDVIFNRINHKGITKGVGQNFEQWKKKLQSVVEK